MHWVLGLFEIHYSVILPVLTPVTSKNTYVIFLQTLYVMFVSLVIIEFVEKWHMYSWTPQELRLARPGSCLDFVEYKALAERLLCGCNCGCLCSQLQWQCWFHCRDTVIDLANSCVTPLSGNALGIWICGCRCILESSGSQNSGCT